jgi:ABC-type uncharacterized transport system permease subunit
MIDLALLAAFIAATIRVATPLLLAAIGEVIAERSGIINLGIEGAMLAGALGAAVGAVAWGPVAGAGTAVLAGMAVAGAVAAVAIGARADQIITGTAVTLGMTGLTGLLARRAFGTSGAGLDIPLFAPVPIPGLAAIPVVGPALFNHPMPTYVAALAVPCAVWLLVRTRWGLELRAAGESGAGAAAAGVRVRRVQVIATLAGGAFAGLAGAALVLAQVGTFTEKMTAGRGFIAIAIVVLGRWHPVGAAAGALLFGAATSLQYLFQASGSTVPYQVFIALPYLLALVVLARAVGRNRGPAGLGRTAG